MPGLSDQATLIYGSRDDISIAYMALRVRNVLVSITVQGANTKYVQASDGSGVKGVTQPLRRKVIEDVEIATGRHLVRILGGQRPAS